jgi:hypothetical protein
MLSVFNRNIEVAIEEKGKAALLFFILKKRLADDHLIPKIKRELSKILFNIDRDSVSINNSPVSKNYSNLHCSITSQNQ